MPWLPDCHGCRARLRAERAERQSAPFFQSAIAGWLVAVVAIICLVLDRR